MFITDAIMRDNNLNEALRWLRQAKADLETAKDTSVAGHYEWACFQSQQAAEKALKAFLYSRRKRNLFTHSVTELAALAGRIDVKFTKMDFEARYLDAYYIPTRYPNGLPGGIIPSDFYTKVEADKCVKASEKIMRLAEASIKK